MLLQSDESTHVEKATTGNQSPQSIGSGDQQVDYISGAKITARTVNVTNVTQHLSEQTNGDPQSIHYVDFNANLEEDPLIGRKQLQGRGPQWVTEHQLPVYVQKQGWTLLMTTDNKRVGYVSRTGSKHFVVLQP